MATTISKAELAKIAELARVNVTDQECAKLQSELEEMFKLFSSVSKLAGGGKVDGKRPGGTTRLRDEQPRLQEGKAATLRNLPGKTDSDGWYVAQPTKLE